MKFLTPEMAEKLGQLGTIPGQISDQQATLSRANALRDMRGPQGTYTRGGYTAANPLEHLAYVGRQFKGGRAAQEAQGNISGMREQQGQTRGEYMKALIEQLRRQQGSSPGGAPGYADPYSGPRMA